MSKKGQPYIISYPKNSPLNALITALKTENQTDILFNLMICLNLVFFLATRQLFTLIHWTPQLYLKHTKVSSLYYTYKKRTLTY